MTMIPKRIYLRKAEFDDLFTSERMVACDEPYSDINVEFTNLSEVWHSASEEPICGKRLLLLHTNSVVSIFEYTGKSSWSMLISCGICQYAYISDLLPKGGEK